MFARTLLALTVLSLHLSAADDLDSLITRTSEKLGGKNSARIVEGRTALRLLVAQQKLREAKVRIRPELSVPPKVPSPGQVLPSTLQGPMNHKQAQEMLKAAREQRQAAKNSDNIATWDLYVERWEAIVADVEQQLDRRVKARGAEAAFSLESIETFAALNEFVLNSPYLKSVDANARNDFEKTAAGLAEIGEVVNEETLKKIPGAGIDRKSIQRLANIQGTWKLEARYGLGPVEVSISGNTVYLESKHLNGSYSAVLEKDLRAGSGTWSGSADGKSYGGDMIIDISEDGKQISMMLYMGPKAKTEATWAIWYARKP